MNKPATNLGQKFLSEEGNPSMFADSIDEVFGMFFQVLFECLAILVGGGIQVCRKKFFGNFSVCNLHRIVKV